MKNLKSLDQHLNEKSTYIKRMEGLVNRNQLNSIFDAADGIIGDMLDDGFEMDEVAEFIKLKIDQYLESKI